MTYQEIDDELNSIIGRLNEMYNQEQDLEEGGAIDLDMALDFRSDSWDGDGDFSAPTPEELQRIQSACDRNCEIVLHNDAERDILFHRYFDLAHTTPHMREIGGYARNYHDKIIPD